MLAAIGNDTIALTDFGAHSLQGNFAFHAQSQTPLSLILECGCSESASDLSHYPTVDITEFHHDFQSLGLTYTYIPPQHYYGNDNLTVITMDLGGSSTEHEVELNIIPVADAATFTPQSLAAFNEDKVVTRTITIEDVDGISDAVSAYGSQNLAVSIESIQFISADGETTTTPQELGDLSAMSLAEIQDLRTQVTLELSPLANFNGTETIDLSFTDILQGNSTQAVSVTIQAIDDATTVNLSTQTTHPETGVISNSVAVIDSASNDTLADVQMWEDSPLALNLTLLDFDQFTSSGISLYSTQNLVNFVADEMNETNEGFHVSGEFQPPSTDRASTPSSLLPMTKTLMDWSQWSFPSKSTPSMMKAP